MSDETQAKETEGVEEPTAESGLEKGSYEILRARLEGHAAELRRRAEELNRRRLELFGGTEMAVVGNERIRTENHCIPRDIVQVGSVEVGPRMLFGYNVFLGLRKEIRVEDVFSLHAFAREDDALDAADDAASGFRFDPLPADAPESFLSDPTFRRDFDELYQYYKDARLDQLRLTEDGKMLMVFGTGGDDQKVLRWAVSPDGDVEYVDNRGERDHVFPPSHGFEWIETTREDHVLGRHPHVSIRDRVFVETVGGDLTVKVEDNTEDGLGIYREDVDEPHQSLADADILYALVGDLILLRIRPYNETEWRHLVFHQRTRDVRRIDAIGQSCQLLPEDHGIIFPGGYYLHTGEWKTFEAASKESLENMRFKRAVRSPNGEDVLYVFYEPDEGRTILLNYNLIRKAVQNPIHCHGWALFDDGKLVIFRSTSPEPTRVHPMQVWQTPFVSELHAAEAQAERAARSPSYLQKIGNAELVRGISDALALARRVTEQKPSVAGFEELIGVATRMEDAYHWLGEAEAGDLAEPVGELRQAADRIVGEYEKVETLRRQAREAVAESETSIRQLFHRLRAESRDRIEPYVRALADLRRERGKLMTLREQRYVDEETVDELEREVIGAFDELSEQTVDFLLGDEALAPYHREIGELVENVEGVETTADAAPALERLEEIGDGLELLTEVVGGLEIDDPTRRTRILESISEVLAALNRARALAEARKKELRSVEGRAEFGAQFQLFSQSVAGALSMAGTPQACDEQLAKLLLQLEELESRFGDLDDFLEQLATKREDVYEAFASKKQALVDERQRRAERMMQSAERVLDGIRRRAAGLEDLDALNTYFVSDAMVGKIRQLARDLRALDEGVKADELDARLQTARQEAARALRDRRDIYEGAGEGEVLRLGRHRFSVERRPLDLTMVPRKDTVPREDTETGERRMAFHLTGTDFYEIIDDPVFAQTREYWNQLLVSETDQVYRGEYLAASILAAAEEETRVPGLGTLDLETLRRADLEGTEGREAEEGGVPRPVDRGLLPLVRRFAAERYDEGYERGLHDHDAARILHHLLALYVTAGLLRFAPRPRALACLFWAFFDDQERRQSWQRRAASLQRLRASFAHSPAIAALQGELTAAIATFLGENGIGIPPDGAASEETLSEGTRSEEIHSEEIQRAGAYLFEELARHPVRFTVAAEAERLRDAFLSAIHAQKREFEEDLRELEDDLENRWHLARAWVDGFVQEEKENDNQEIAALEPSLDEAVALLLTERRLDRSTSSALPARTVDGLLGQHPRIRDREMELRLDEFLGRLTAFRTERVPGFRRFQERRHALLEREKTRLRLDEYRPKVMSAFVRNQLIQEVYLPLVGDNLAKQMGTVGEGKRTDQMGLLLLISPPGYGKTTLMEYIANRLGLIFVKVNGPALGHGVVSLDPSEAPNATSRQEVEKVNFALEMGNNVLLYVDDIQHTSSEFLQKFISLCDAQRRIEGVWNGRSRTYDLKGKRFAVCMAGNPYTESGETFQIPDMLANRADTYNLGDILEGRDETFALSYLENSLTSNPVLAPLAGRELSDVPKLVRMARSGASGEATGQADQLHHGYSQVELEEILSVLSKLLVIQGVVLRVNQQYIASAAQDDRFRTEPRFQLQGSYRNMNKMAEKVVAVMNDAELEALIDDHYRGEAQTLTTGAEANLLKLAEMRGKLTPEQKERWEEIKRSYARVQAMGGAEDDPAVKLVGQLGLMSDRLGDIDRAIQRAAEGNGDADRRPEAAVGESLADALSTTLAPLADALQKNLEALREQGAGKTAGDGAVLQALGERLDQLTAHLAHIAAQFAERAAQPPPASASDGESEAAAPSVLPQTVQVDFGPYLERLDRTLGKMAETKSTTVVQSLGPGVVELLESMNEAIAGQLLPVTQALDAFVDDHGIEDRHLENRIDRALRNLDMMKDLVGSLRKIETGG